MGMQCHFQVSDIPEYIKVHKHSDKNDDTDIGGDVWIDSYIVVDPNSFMFNTDAKHESAWFDIGQMSESAMIKLQWLIANRICFNCS